MKKNGILITVLIVIVILLLTYVIFFTTFFRSIKTSSEQNAQFPPSNVECFNIFMNAVNSGYADGFKIPPFNFSDISHFKCASKLAFDQYEINGISKDGHSFYVHRDEGGMASSGSDSYFDFCYKKDNVIISSDKIIGHNSHQAGTCVWTENFPSNPTSIYEYNIK